VKWSGCTFILSGKENLPSKGPVVYVANHQSIFDIGAFFAYLPFPKGFIAKIETQKIPIMRSWMVEMNCIFMDRQNIKKSAQSIADGVEILKKGHSSMVIFPEGHRSRSDLLGEFKSGSFKLALRSKVPIIPITIDGTYKGLEANNFFVKPVDIKITIHPVIETADLTRDEAIALPKKVKEIIASKLPNHES
jgi:1-acyl-sn-glycerol-3-phosphate acyltransferase